MATTAALAVPAAAASLAYLNARWSLFNDWAIIKALATARSSAAKREKNGRLNAFYLLQETAQSPKTADGIFIIYGSQRWTFQQSYDMTLRYAGWLHRTHRVTPGEIVAIDFMNSHHFVFLTLALWSLGAVPALINYNLSGKPLVHCLRVSSARLLIVDPEIQHNLTAEVMAEFNSSTFRNNAFPLEVVHLDHAFASSLPYFPPHLAPDSARSDITGWSIGALIYTSGTTGLPKAAIIPWHRIGAAGFIAGWMGLRPVYSSYPDRYYTCMPLYHGTAFLCCFLACLHGRTTMVIGHRFSSRTFWQEVRRSGATVIEYVGETLRYLLATPPERDPNDPSRNLDKDNKVRMAFGNGLRPDVWEKFKARFDIETICEFYTATEGTNGSWNLSSNSFASGAIGRNGKLMELLLKRETAIVKVDWETETPWRDPKTGLCQQVPRGEVGELLYAVDPEKIGEKYSGYFNNETASSSKIFREAIKKGDAWFRTGDVVRWDKEGRWWFSDRIGDTFRWKSENVSTNEVSEALGHHPKILEANVYGVEIPGHEGRAGCAALLLDGEANENDFESIATVARNSLPKYAVPTFLRVVKEVSATGNNKQQKHVMKKEGVDPDLVMTHGDRMYWLKGGTFVPFERRDWNELKGGRVKL